MGLGVRGQLCRWCTLHAQGMRLLLRLISATNTSTTTVVAAAVDFVGVLVVGPVATHENDSYLYERTGVAQPKNAFLTRGGEGVAGPTKLL